MKIAYRAFITILIAFAFGMTVIGFVKHIPLVFFLSLACIFVAIAFYIFKSAHYQVRFKNERDERERQACINCHLTNKLHIYEEDINKLHICEEDK